MTLTQNRVSNHIDLNGGEYPTTSYVTPSLFGILDTPSFKDAAESFELEVCKARSAEFKVAGRIAFIRNSKAISFVKIKDETGILQLICTKVLIDAEMMKHFDLGDIIEATGVACKSKAGEHSLLVTGIRLLTKCINPPPEKFAGIADQETKYRQRYLDLMTDPNSMEVFKTRAKILHHIRLYMVDRNFMEVDTGILTPISSGANAKPFVTHHEALDQDMYLRIAPELNLKKLLVGGFRKVFEIAKVFRNEGISAKHSPEFTIMEYYEAYGSFSDLARNTIAMLRHLEWVLPSTERKFTLSEYAVVTMKDAVLASCKKKDIKLHPDFRMVTHGEENPINIAFASLVNSLESPGLRIAKLFEEFAEPELEEDYRCGMHSIPVFITEHPIETSPLARPSDKDNAFTDRFELFICGMEIANAYQELNCPFTQEANFLSQVEKNAADPMQLDQDYLEALKYGMPPAIGFGCGIDRLCVLFSNASNIKDVILFPTLKKL